MPSQVQRLLLYWNTLRHLKLVQIYGRILFRIRRPRPDLRSPAERRHAVRSLPFPAWRDAAMQTAETFVFLNEKGQLRAPEDWNAPDRTKLWIYNLHYFDDLTARDADERASWHQALIARWIAENKPAIGQGWEPYPASLRIVNWIKWLADGHAPPPEMIGNLAIQTRWLAQRMEHHLLGNHLIANAKALMFAGLFFQGVEAGDWYSDAARIFERELDEQVLADGAHFELSPMYHHIILDDILDLIHIHRVFGVTPPNGWSRIAARMLAWAQAMLHPDSAIAFFNDAAFSIAPAYDDLAGHAAMLDIPIPAPIADRLIHLRPSGYVRMTALNSVLIADIAAVGPDYLPAHAHADTLSFELSLGGERVIVNGGTSVYGMDEERHRQRSTAAHATLTLDDRNSSEVWGGFRVGRRAKVSNVQVMESADHAIVEATHDGYANLPGSPLHSRRWQLGAGQLSVQDRVTGRGVHEILVVFPLRPGLGARRTDGNSLVVFETASQHPVASFAFGSGDLSIAPSTWHPEFGKAVPNLRIELRLRASLPLTCDTLIEWPVP